MTGEQLEITHGPASAVVTTVGAGLRAFEVGGVPYVETYDDEPPMGAGAVLVPWPNRVAGATWSQNGEKHTLEATEAARGNAIHGLVRRAPWTVVSHEDSAVTLEVAVDGAPGWPFPFSTTISYALSDGGLTVTHTVANRGERGDAVRRRHTPVPAARRRRRRRLRADARRAAPCCRSTWTR